MHHALWQRCVRPRGEACDPAADPQQQCDHSCLFLPRCGDGALDAGEACDDGNDAPGDGCSTACELEDGFTCFSAPETVLRKETAVAAFDAAGPFVYWASSSPHVERMDASNQRWERHLLHGAAGEEISVAELRPAIWGPWSSHVTRATTVLGNGNCGGCKANDGAMLRQHFRLRSPACLPGPRLKPSSGRAIG